MAPEQAAGAADARSDVYALGGILRDLIEIPIGPTIEPRPPKPLTSIVLRAMGSDPAARYAGPADLAADVRRFLDGAAVAAHREGPLERLGRLAGTYRTPLALIAAYLAMRLLLLFWRS
jgi:hypothetical protein